MALAGVTPVALILIVAALAAAAGLQPGFRGYDENNMLRREPFQLEPGMRLSEIVPVQAAGLSRLWIEYSTVDRSRRPEISIRVTADGIEVVRRLYQPPNSEVPTGRRSWLGGGMELVGGSRWLEVDLGGQAGVTDPPALVRLEVGVPPGAPPVDVFTYAVKPRVGIGPAEFAGALEQPALEEVEGRRMVVRTGYGQAGSLLNRVPILVERASALSGGVLPGWLLWLAIAACLLLAAVLTHLATAAEAQHFDPDPEPPTGRAAAGSGPAGNL